MPSPFTCSPVIRECREKKNPDRKKIDETDDPFSYSILLGNWSSMVTMVFFIPLYDSDTETYSESCQASKMELFAKIEVYSP